MFGVGVILLVADTFDNQIGVATAESAVGAGKFRVEFDGPFEMADGNLHIFAGERMIDKTAHRVASAQEFFVGFSVFRGAVFKTLHFIG